MSAATARLFVALWPDDTVRAALRARRDGWQWPGTAAPVATEKLHMTLHFLGDVEHDRIPALRAALALPFEPFELRFGQDVLWPRGLAVLEPEAVPASLLALQSRLGTVLDGLCIAQDSRPYKPHVTLARRAGAAVLARQGAPISWLVERYALVQSADGYVPLQTYFSHG